MRLLAILAVGLGFKAYRAYRVGGLGFGVWGLGGGGCLDKV